MMERFFPIVLVITLAVTLLLCVVSAEDVVTTTATPTPSRLAVSTVAVYSDDAGGVWLQGDVMSLGTETEVYAYFLHGMTKNFSLNCPSSPTTAATYMDAPGIHIDKLPSALMRGLGTYYFVFCVVRGSDGSHLCDGELAYCPLTGLAQECP